MKPYFPGRNENHDFFKTTTDILKVLKEVAKCNQNKLISTWKDHSEEGFIKGTHRKGKSIPVKGYFVKFRQE